MGDMRSCAEHGTDCGCFDYQQIKADRDDARELVAVRTAEVERLREELRIARFDAEVPLRELREENERLRTDLAASRSAADTLAGARDRLYLEVERLRDERGRARDLLVSLIGWADDGMAATGTPESLAALARARVYLADDTEGADDHAREVEWDG